MSPPRPYIRHQVSPALAATREATLWDPRPRYFARLDLGLPPEILALRERMRREARELITLGVVPSSRRELARTFGVTEWRARREKEEILLHVGPREAAAYQARLQEVGRLRLTAELVADEDVEADAERWDRRRAPQRSDELVDLIRQRLSLATWRALSGFTAEELLAHVRQIHVLFLGRQPTRPELMRSWERILVCTAHAMRQDAKRQAASLAEHLEQVAVIVTAIRESRLYSFRFIRGEIRPKSGVAVDRRADAGFVVYAKLWDVRLEDAHQHAAGVVQDDDRHQRQQRLPLPKPQKAQKEAAAAHNMVVIDLVTASLVEGDVAGLEIPLRNILHNGGYDELVSQLELRGIGPERLLEVLERFGIDPP